MKENTKIERSTRTTTIKAKSDPWSVSRRVRLPHKPGVPLGSGGGSDSGGAGGGGGGGGAGGGSE